MQTCKRCKEDLPKEAFKGTRADRPRVVCKDCRDKVKPLEPGETASQRKWRSASCLP